MEWLTVLLFSVLILNYSGHLTRLPCDPWSCVKGEEISFLLLKLPSILSDVYTSRKSGKIFRNLRSVLLFFFPRPVQSRSNSLSFCTFPFAIHTGFGLSIPQDLCIIQQIRDFHLILKSQQEKILFLILLSIRKTMNIRQWISCPFLKYNRMNINNRTHKCKASNVRKHDKLEQSDQVDFKIVH